MQALATYSLWNNAVLVRFFLKGQGAPDTQIPVCAIREEMYQARPLSRNLFLYTFLQNHGPGFLDDQGSGLPGVTSILEFHPISPYSDSPHYLAMQLASIADEMELRLLLPQFVEPFWMPMYSLCFPYSHVGLRDVLRSFMVAFTNLRENRRLWSFLTLRDRELPSSGRPAAHSCLLSQRAAFRTPPLPSPSVRAECRSPFCQYHTGFPGRPAARSGPASSPAAPSGPRSSPTPPVFLIFPVTPSQTPQFFLRPPC
ncbi:hypothetical protein MJG53_003868 [Ovis ammon polii x Ovis aries]|uniref:Uncharacterized protein n=1 Tax=Ovis ammon polii x Ovis aries TaxID=2918886 RepID=A0ACB9V830_9CETA|nr:hypothetical protein MJG53_003868 [Ovis ammon polii x Ovis aries]